MIDRLLPTSIGVASSFGDREAALFPEEEGALGTASAGRRKEFATGRDCARRAMRALGWPPALVGRGMQRQPLWPTGLVGSITHCRGYRAAAVGDRSSWAAIGIDAEPDRPLPDGVTPEVTHPVERRLWSAVSGVENWGRVVFSAKESVYKAWFALYETWLGFHDVVLLPDGPGGHFVAQLVGPRDERQRFTGRYVVADDLVATAVVVRSGPDILPDRARCV